MADGKQVNGTPEYNVKASGKLAAAECGAVTFENPVGGAWVCPPNKRKKSKRNGVSIVTLESPRWVDYGLCQGSGDTIGWITQEITQDMVGQKVARFVSIEYKTCDGRPREGQQQWHEAVWRAGGYTGFARCDDDVRRILSGVKVDA